MASGLADLKRLMDESRQQATRFASLDETLRVLSSEQQQAVAPTLVAPVGATATTGAVPRSTGSAFGGLRATREPYREPFEQKQEETKRAATETVSSGFEAVASRSGKADYFARQAVVQDELDKARSMSSSTRLKQLVDFVDSLTSIFATQNASRLYTDHFNADRLSYETDLKWTDVVNPLYRDVIDKAVSDVYKFAPRATRNKSKTDILIWEEISRPLKDLIKFYQDNSVASRAGRYMQDQTRENLDIMYGAAIDTLVRFNAASGFAVVV